MAARRIAVATALGVGALSAGSGAALGAPSGPSVIPGAGAPRVTSQSVNLPLGTVDTTTHRHLELYGSVTVLTQQADGDGFLAELATSGQRESHSWSFPIKAATLHVSTSGSGSFRSGSAGGRYASLDVSFTPIAAPSKDACNAGDFQLTRPERMTGTLELHTGSATWGSVTDRFSATIRSGLVTVYGSPQCHSPVEPCRASTSWFYGGRSVTFGGSSGPATVYATRTVTLGRPAGAMRTDDVFAPSPAPAVEGRGSSARLVVATSGHGATGAISLPSSGPPFAAPVSCRSGGRTVTRSATSWYTAAFHGARLRLAEQAFGPIEMPRHEASGEFFRSAG